jgi:hypothetical protein
LSFVICTLVGVAGILFYVAGTKTRRHAVQVPIAREMGPTAAVAGGRADDSLALPWD